MNQIEDQSSVSCWLYIKNHLQKINNIASLPMQLQWQIAFNAKIIKISVNETYNYKSQNKQLFYIVKGSPLILVTNCLNSNRQFSDSNVIYRNRTVEILEKCNNQQSIMIKSYHKAELSDIDLMHQDFKQFHPCNYFQIFTSQKIIIKCTDQCEMIIVQKNMLNKMKKIQQQISHYSSNFIMAYTQEGLKLQNSLRSIFDNKTTSKRSNTFINKALKSFPVRKHFKLKKEKTRLLTLY